eukprot:502882_1
MEKHTFQIAEKEALLTKTHNKTPLFVYIAALLCCMSSLNTGYDIGIISTAIIYIESDLEINNTQIELIVASANFFAIIGALSGGNLAHLYGRKTVIILSAIISCVAVIMMSLTSNLFIILLSRSMNGISIGMSLSIAPLYISELTPSNIRGTVVTLSEIFINIGHVLGYIMALLFYYFDVSVSISWRIMVGSGSIISFILFVSMLFMPESPRWLNKNGYSEKAKQVLIKTISKSNPTAMKQVEELIYDMDETNKILDKNPIGWKQIVLFCIFKPDIALKKALFIAIPVALFQQLCGIEIFVYYIPKILQNNGLNDEWIFLGTIFIGLSKLLVLLITQSLMDTLGRRLLMMISSFTMAISVCIFGVIVQYEDNIKENVLFIIIISILICITGTFSLGYGPITWLINAEIFALNVRSKAMGYCTFLNRLAATVVTLTFFSLSTVITRHGVYYLYSILGFMYGIFVFFNVPETKNQSLEQITKMLISQ